jgi:hypothetical protein
MRSPWIQFARVGFLIFALFALSGLIPYLQYAASNGWPGGFFSYMRAILAAWFGGLHWYLPVGALVGGVSVTASSDGRRHTRLLETILVCAGLALLSFAIRGFIGPHLEHHAHLGLLDMTIERNAEVAASLRPNDWNFFRTLAARGEDEGASLAMVHSTIAFAVLSAIMLPLGLAIGHGSRRFLGPARGRAAWAMAAATTTVVYAAQIGAWRVALSTEAWTGELVYFGFLIVPLVMLLALAWSGTAWPPSDGRLPPGTAS